LNSYQLKSAAWVKAQTFQLRHHKNCNFDFFFVTYDPKKLHTRHKWREEDDEEITQHDEERERENEEEGNEHEKEHTKKEKAKASGKNANNCGCCCDDADEKTKFNRQRNNRGEPDETDDVTENTRPYKPHPPRPYTPEPTPNPKVRPPTPKPKPDPTPTPKPPGKGELNEEYGLYIERPFYIISSCGENRYMDVVDEKNLVIKTPNEYDSQKWWFDQKSLTIKNQMFEDKSLDITNSGKTDDMQVWKTNGKWF
jgi:hypothetical protein